MTHKLNEKHPIHKQWFEYITLEVAWYFVTQHINRARTIQDIKQ